MKSELGKELLIYVENSPTILSRIIQTIKGKRINIISFHAEEETESNTGIVIIEINSDEDNVRKLKLKLNKLIDVILVANNQSNISDMLLITHTKDSGSRLAFLIGDRVYDCHEVHPGLPETGEEFVANWERYKALALLMNNALSTNSVKRDLAFIEIGEAVDVKALVWDETKSK